ncbi:hypothetical protein [Thermococcus sp. Bubb.Bath]|uniref:hypothetical protein n=1 Tax=Thermococcus sp. Bubb.Bath TaxID=1638242 RepID=UPI00143C3A0A|nr:hypothetical protein [Thermococcus sp. Bubb.Bath]NJF24401.1 hypothetical protein [Thermococcus sp. Bubb.Bath]
MARMRVYPRYEVEIEGGSELLELLFGAEAGETAVLTLYESVAEFQFPGMTLGLVYTKENAKTLIEFLKVFAERVKLEEERKRLLH